MNLALQSDLLANHKLHARTVFQGLPISVENRAGSTRRGVDPGGKPWATKMVYPYGYLRRTEGVDGDHIDCFIGPHKDAANAYIIDIRKPPAFEKFDEQKVMLGFNSPADAKRAFLLHYDNPKFFGKITAVPMADFKQKALGTFGNPTKLAAAIGMRLGTLQSYGTTEGALKGWDERGRGNKAPHEMTHNDMVDVEPFMFPKGSFKGELRNASGGRVANVYVYDHKVYIAEPREFGRGEIDKMLPGAYDPQQFEKAGGSQVSSSQRVQYWKFKNPSQSVNAYGTSDGAVKGWDTRGRGRKTPAEGLASPNVREGTTLNDALSALQSDRHAEFSAKANDVVSELAKDGSVADAIGSWKDGAEDTVVLSGTMSWDDICYATAQMGLEGNQKGVIAFHQEPRGKDSMWSVSINGDYTAAQVSDKLDQLGISDRTIIPSKGGFDVHVFDSGSSMEGKITEVAKTYGTNYTQRVGRGEYIGGSTREEGSAAFRDVITKYKAGRGIHSAQDGGGRRTGHRDLLGPSAKKVTSLDRTIALHCWGQGAQIGIAHIEPMPTVHPPSLRNPQRIPVDAPWETDDRFGDVSRRRKAEKFRYELMRHHGPGQREVSVRTTSIGWQPVAVTVGV